MLISVIVPVYNVEDYLSQCINSVLMQTHEEFELILVDDGSTDSSKNICDYYARLDSRIVVIHQKNVGIAESRNIGIKSSSGECVFFLDSDDYLDKNSLEMMSSNMLKDCSVDMVICQFQTFHQNNGRVNINSNNHLPSTFSGRDALQWFLTGEDKCFITVWGKLFKRHLFNEKIIFPSGFVHEDNLTIYKLYNNCIKIGYLNYPFYFYRICDNSIMRTFEFGREYDYFVKAFEMIDNISLVISENVIDYWKCMHCLTFCKLLEKNHYPERKNIFKRVCYYLPDNINYSKFDLNKKMALFSLKYNLFFAFSVMFKIKNILNEKKGLYF